MTARYIITGAEVIGHPDDRMLCEDFGRKLGAALKGRDIRAFNVHDFNEMDSGSSRIIKTQIGAVAYRSFDMEGVAMMLLLDVYPSRAKLQYSFGLFIITLTLLPVRRDPGYVREVWE